MNALNRSLFRRIEALTGLPEFNVMLFAFLLNYPWEFIQSPLFADMANRPHWEAVKGCTRATLGDAVIMLTAYWGVSTLRRDRAWISAATRGDVLMLIFVGVCITAIIEWLVLHGWWLQSWRYSAAMPLIPWLGIGWVPVFQWLILPPLVVGLAGRQLRGHRA